MEQGPENDNLKEFFAPGSLLPVATLCNFRIQRLIAEVIVDPKRRSARWKKTYHLEKVRDVHPSNDHWIEVTGCPSGKLDRAYDGGNGYAFSPSRDAKNNLNHRIDFGTKLEIGSKPILTLEFTTETLEAEDKLLLISKTQPLHKSFLFRYDQGYSVECDILELLIKVSGGRILGAWPRALSQNPESDQVKFIKQKMRPYEVVTPLVHIETGSRRWALVIQAGVTLALGVMGNALFAALR